MSRMEITSTKLYTKFINSKQAFLREILKATRSTTIYRFISSTEGRKLWGREALFFRLLRLKLEIEDHPHELLVVDLYDAVLIGVVLPERLSQRLKEKRLQSLRLGNFLHFVLLKNETYIKVHCFEVIGQKLKNVMTFCVSTLRGATGHTVHMTRYLFRHKL